MKPWQYDLTAVRVLWRHELLELWRRPIWLLAALVPAVVAWLLVSLVVVAAAPTAFAGLGANEFLFSGAVVLVLAQAALVAGGGTLRPERLGLTRLLLAGPASVGAVAIGKCLAAATAALVPAVAFVLLAPLAGLDLAAADWATLIGVLLLGALGSSAVSLALRRFTASRIRHLALTTLVLLPLWVISGAAQPYGNDQTWLARLASFNPIAYGVSAARHALYGGHAPPAIVLSQNAGLELGTLACFCAVAVIAAVLALRRPA